MQYIFWWITILMKNKCVLCNEVWIDVAFLFPFFTKKPILRYHFLLNPRSESHSGTWYSDYRHEHPAEKVGKRRYRREAWGVRSFLRSASARKRERSIALHVSRDNLILCRRDVKVKSTENSWISREYFDAISCEIYVFDNISLRILPFT